MIDIVHVNFSDVQGGASIAAYRHSEALGLINGISSKLVVADKQTQNVNVICMVKSWRERLLKKVYLKYANFLIKVCRLRRNTFYSYTSMSFNLCRIKEIKEADIIVIHWINSMTTSVLGVEKILKLGKPTFLFLHDMWYMTGGCHYSLGCKRYQQQGCGCCEILSNMIVDLPKRQFSQKLKWGKYENLHVLAPSYWLCRLAKESIILKNCDIQLYRNVIDTNLFTLRDKNKCKKYFGLSLKKKTIMFVAVSLNSPFKGWHYLQSMLWNLNEEEYQCLVVGAANVDIVSNLNMSIRFTGYLSDSDSLITAYNAADIFVTTSIAENFPNVLLEAMACGIPCIGFNVGGIPEAIIHKETGYIAKVRDELDLKTGVEWCLDKQNYSTICRNCREKIMKEFSYNSIKNRADVFKSN